MKLCEITPEYNFSCIYKWENQINHKVYIGQAANMYIRFLEYKKGRFNVHMANAINKYSLDNFEIDVIERDVPLDKITEREQFWIDNFQSYNRDKGYNICKYAKTTKGYKYSIESRKRMSDIAKTRVGDKNPFYGKHHTEDTKRKISEANSRPTGRKPSEAQREAMLTGLKNKTSKPVVQYDINGIFIAEYESISDASTKTGFSNSSIGRCASGKYKQAHGFIWRYAG